MIEINFPREAKDVKNIEGRGIKRGQREREWERNEGWKVQNIKRQSQWVRIKLPGALPTFGTGECALRHEERVNGGRLTTPTSVSMASQLWIHCCSDWRYFPWLKLEEKHSAVYLNALSLSRWLITTDGFGERGRKKATLYFLIHSAHGLSRKCKGREWRRWTLIDSTLPEVSGYYCTALHSSRESLPSLWDLSKSYS